MVVAQEEPGLRRVEKGRAKVTADGELDIDVEVVDEPDHWHGLRYYQTAAALAALRLAQRHCSAVAARSDDLCEERSGRESHFAGRAPAPSRVSQLRRG